MLTGTGERQIKQITANTATQLTFAVGTSPAADTTYKVQDSPPAHVGTATAGAAGTITDSNAACGTSDELVGAWVIITGGTGSGQSRRITAHNATVLTVGGANWTVTPDATSVYEVFGSVAIHTYTLSDSIDGIFETFCMDNNVNVHEYGGLKLTGFTLKGEVGQPLQVEFNAIAQDLEVASVTNTLATFANVTFRETANRVLFDQMVIRMNDQGGIALAAGDKIYPNSFEFTFQRTMEGVYATDSGFDVVDEPTNSGQPELSLKMTFPRYTETTYFTDWNADTPKKADMTFTGSAITGTATRSFQIELCHLDYQSVELPIEQGILSHPIEFRVLGAVTAPSGMSGLTEPFRVTLTNEYGGDVLQDGN